MPDAHRAILLALAKQAREAELYWQAGTAATRARGLTPSRTEAFAHHTRAELSLLIALRAAGIPPNFHIDGITLSRDPLAAMQQLRGHVAAHQPSNPIETDHEAARLAYRHTFAAPPTAQEQHLAATLAGLPAARRDKINELAETLARADQT